MNAVTQNVERIRKELAPFNAQLVGVAKGQSTAALREAAEAGLLDLGHNYTQEGEKQRAELKDLAIRWHFIGHIQSRKAKEVSEYDCVQSLDRREVAENLDRLRLGNSRLPVLVQINIGREPQKSGIHPEQLQPFLERIAELPHLKIAGLMVLPPALKPVHLRCPFFREARGLYEQWRQDFSFEWLSMGTSEDYHIAVQEGSNMVRLGAAVFGPRAKKPAL